MMPVMLRAPISMLQPLKAWKPPKDFETLCALSINDEKSRICTVIRLSGRPLTYPYRASF
jgi:hypothetical protein